MEGSPGLLHHHVDALDFTKDCGLLVAASSLTNKFWVGALFYYENADDAPNTEDVSVAMRQLDAGVSDIKAVKDSDNFLCGTDTGSVQFWKIQSGEDIDPVDKMMCMAEPAEHDDYITSLSIGAYQCKAVSSSVDCHVKVWDLKEFKCTNTYKAHSDSVSMVSCHHTDPQVFASCSQDGNMLLWDSRKSKPATVIENQFLPSAPTCIAWKPDQQHSIAIGTETGEVLLQDTRKGVGQPIIKKLHDRAVNSLKFAPHNSNWLATASDDGQALVLQYDSDTEASIVDKVTGHTDFVRDVAWHPANHKLYTCGWDSQVLANAISSQEKLKLHNGTNCEVATKAATNFKDITDINKKINSKIEQMDVTSTGVTHVET